MTAESGDGRRLFLECSATYRHDRETGIQRVTRNVIRESVAQAAERNVDVVPVFYSAGAFRRAKLAPDGTLASLPLPPPVSVMPLRRAYRQALRGLAAAVPHQGARKWLVAPGTHPGLTRQIRKLAGAVRHGGHADLPDVELEHETVEPRPGDILLFVDLYISAELGAYLRTQRERGVTIATLIYDLIPVNRPHMWHAEFIDGFRDWLNMVVESADILVSISASVRDEVAAYARRDGRAWPQPGQRNTYFHLGYELDRRSGDPTIRPELVALFSDRSAPIFLHVGWLDPRKNQTFLVDALDALWRRGIESKVLLVGRQGLGTKALMRHLKQRPRSRNRVLLFDDLTDDELEYCYAHSDALVYPSLEEGFGLPLIEALSRGLPVFASDISVFRELAADYAVFFGLDTPDELSRHLENFCRTREYPSIRPLSDFRWPVWRESIGRLLDIVLEPARR